MFPAQVVIMLLQPVLSNGIVKLEPLSFEHFELLFAVASDPLIWEQHPNKDRYQRPVFENFFKGAMESGGAFLIKDAQNGEVLGSSRYYDLSTDHVLVGYTFLSRSCWGKGINLQVKTLMLDHAFRYVDKVLFHVGSVNIRSQMAMERIGGKRIGEQSVEYYGEPAKPNVVFSISKADWEARLPQSA